MTVRFLAAFGISVLHALSSHAELIGVTFDGNNSSTSLGSIAETADNIDANSGSPATISFRISGLTIDSVGTADDTVDFSVALSGTGSGGILGFGNAGGDWGVNSPGTGGENANQLDVVGESITFALQSSMVTLGAGATETGMLEFIGFTGFDATAFGDGDRFDLSGTSSDGTGLSADPTFDGTSSFTVTYNDNNGSNNGFRIGDVAATFNVTATSVAVPDPGTFVGLCLGLLGVVTYRRGRRGRRVSQATS